MTPERWRRIEALFRRALESPLATRENLLAEACGDDDALRAEVEALLAADLEAGSFLDRPASPSPPGRPLPLRPGERRIGAYLLLSTLGEGGTSTVYLAVDRRRRGSGLVALKLLREGPARRALRRRILLEGRILSRLEHPGIARLLDSGRTSGGLPYLITEYVAPGPECGAAGPGRLGPPRPGGAAAPPGTPPGGSRGVRDRPRHAPQASRGGPSKGGGDLARPR